MQNNNASNPNSTPFITSFSQNEDGTWILNSPTLILPDEIEVKLRNISDVELITQEACSELKITTISGSVFTCRLTDIPDTRLLAYAKAILDVIHDESKLAALEQNTPDKTQASDVQKDIESIQGEMTANAADTTQTPHQNDVNATTTDVPQEDQSKNETPKINTDNAQNNYKQNPIKCFFNMYRYTFTMKARTGRREFFIAAGIHFGLLLALSIFAYNDIDHNCHGDGGMGCAFFYLLMLPIFIFIVQYFPFTNMIIRRCMDSEIIQTEDDYKKRKRFYRNIFHITPLVIFFIFIFLFICLKVQKEAGGFVWVIIFLGCLCVHAGYTLYKIFKPSAPKGLLKRI